MREILELPEPERRAQLHAEIARLLETEKLTNPVSYNLDDPPYQTYDRIGFAGSRWSVEKRIEAYGLNRFFDPASRILDIGSNSGFFVVEFALHCAFAHGVEPTPELNRIGEIAAEFLGVGHKVRFYDCPFESFESGVVYDAVLSLAAFFTFDGRERSLADAYFGKIDRLLAPDGSLFYESTSHSRREGHSNDPFWRAASEAERAIGERFEIERCWLEETRPDSGSFRRYVLARKRAAKRIVGETP